MLVQRSNDRWQLVGVHVGENQQISRCFTSSIGAARFEWGIFAETFPSGGAAIYLVGADLDKERQPINSRSFQQNVRPYNIGLEEGVGMFDAAIHMSFRGEIDDGSETALQQLVHHRCLGDVPAHKAVVVVVGHIGEIFQVTGVGEFVQVSDFEIVTLAEQVVYKVRADEAGTACDQKLHAAFRRVTSF